MNRLIPNSLPAELARGLSFSETLESAFAVAQNGGVVSGTPRIDFGMWLNGTTEYGTWGLDGSEFAGTVLSLVSPFYPEFAHDDNLEHYISDTNASNYSVLKLASNALRIRMGGTNIADIPNGSFAPYWLLNRRNVLVISSDASGNTNAWLNGNQVLTNDTTAWTSVAVSSLVLGRAVGGGSYFQGKYGDFKVFKALLTEQEAIDFYNRATYSYRFEALLDLPMRMAEHDVSNVRTLDITGNDHHGIFGDGVTPSTYATKLDAHGYLLDGVNDYFGGLPALAGDFTVCVLANNAVNFYNNDTVYNTIRTSGAFAGNLQRPTVWEKLLTPIQKLDWAQQLMREVNTI